MTDEPRSEAQGGGEPESIAALLDRAQHGDRAALDRLFQRCYPVIRRLAHGRLPDRIRGQMDTPDLIQVTFLRALRGLKDFSSRWEDAWLIYLRRILFNYLRDEGRRARRLPDRGELPEDDGPGALASPAPSPLDEAAVKETFSQYRTALERLAPHERNAVILRLEQGEHYERIAVALGLPSEDAARMLVKRSIGKVADMVSPPAQPE